MRTFLKKIISLVPVYGHIYGYLHRWQILSFWKLSIRIHRIHIPDGTPFLHTHPFSYLSIVLQGGYSETVLGPKEFLNCKFHRPGSFIFRRSSTAHRITAVQKNCTTLFFAWSSCGKETQGWTLLRHPNIVAPCTYIDWPDGIYKVKDGFRKRQNGVWFALQPTADSAKNCQRLSIRQDIKKATIL